MITDRKAGPNRCPFAQLSGPLLRLGLDLCQERTTWSQYTHDYDEILTKCGWTREEYEAEIDKHWSGQWSVTENPTA